MNAETSIKPIVVGVDGSRYSREALRWAWDEAERRGCSVRALMVWHTEAVIAAGRPTIVGLGTQLPGDPGPEYLQLLDDTVREVLGERGDPGVDAELVRGGPPEVLVRASADAQLLVVGSHGHRRWVEAVLGSVAQYCTRHAACPVVVIPARLVDQLAEKQRSGLTSELAHLPWGDGLGPLL